MPFWLLIVWPLFVIVTAAIIPICADIYTENKRKEREQNGDSGAGEKDD